MHRLVDAKEPGIPNKPTSFPPYFPLRDQLSTADGVAKVTDRNILPHSLREDYLIAFHSVHQGVITMISRAETSVF